MPAVEGRASRRAALSLVTRAGGLFIACRAARSVWHCRTLQALGLVRAPSTHTHTHAPHWDGAHASTHQRPRPSPRSEALTRARCLARAPASCSGAGERRRGVQVLADGLVVSGPWTCVDTKGVPLPVARRADQHSLGVQVAEQPPRRAGGGGRLDVVACGGAGLAAGQCGFPAPWPHSCPLGGEGQQVSGC